MSSILAVKSRDGSKRPMPVWELEDGEEGSGGDAGRSGFSW